MKLSNFMLSALAMCAISSSAGDLKLDMSQSYGLSIQSPLGDISACSRIIAIEPPWEEFYFYNRRAQLEFDKSVVDGVQKVAMNQTGDAKFKILEYSATESDNKVNVIFRGELTEDVPCNVEYSIFQVIAYILEGATYTATLSNGDVVTGELPVGETIAKTYVSNAKKIDFDSQYGQLTVTVTKGTGIDLANRRDVEFEGFRGYWMGNFSTPLKYGEIFEKEVELEFIRNKDIIVPTPVINQLAEEPIKAVEQNELRRAMEEINLPILPVIKQQTLLPKAALTLGKKLNLELDFNDTPAEVEKLTNAINRVYGKLETSKTGSTHVRAKVGDNFFGLKSPADPEGYAIQIDAKGIKIISKTARGVYYAMQTLRSLENDGKIPAQNILDYPDMEFRGIHLLADDGSLDLHGPMAMELFGRYKINHIVYEIEYVAWDSTKALHQPKAMSKAQLKEFLKICDENYIDVSPLFQTLGHLEWFFNNGQNLEMAEDPATPYAYNVSHPDVYPTMTKIMEEVIEAFDNPEYMHIGHDEVDMIGRFPYQPENVERGIADVVMSDIMFYYNYLTERGIKVMMWHDMIMTSKESSNSHGMWLENVKEYRDTLPRDIVIADWNYCGTVSKGDFPCIQLLTDEGFPTLGCTWTQTNNVENMAMAVNKAKAWGLLGTTWTGYFGSDASLEKYFYQLATYLRVASWAWNCSPEANADYYDFQKQFSILINQIWERSEADYGTKGQTISLDNVANIEIANSTNPFMSDTDMGLNQALKAGELNFVGDMAFDIANINGNVGAIALNSGVNRQFPQSLTINLDNLECNNLYFLHTTLADSISSDQNTANCLVTYEDGSTVQVPFIYGKNLGSLRFEVFAYDMTPYEALDYEVDGEKRFLVYATWQNPNPDKKITALTFSTGANLQPYYLLGISAQ